MSYASVKTYLASFGLADRAKEFPVSSATVELAAQALGVAGQRIAKTLALADGNPSGCLLVVTAGDTKIDNAKFKAKFGMKARMLSPDETLALTGHAVGGVCPFDLPTDIPVWLDESLRRFDTVFPACGSSNSAIELDMETLQKVSKARGWADICKLRESEGAVQ